MVPWCHGKVVPKRFHLIGHTIGFRSQTQKLEPYSIAIIHVYTIDSGCSPQTFNISLIQALHFLETLQTIMPPEK